MTLSRWGARIGAAGILWLAGAGTARAEEPSTVILLRPPRADQVVLEATIRLEAELRAAGFQVRVLEGPAGGDGRAEVEGSVPPGAAGSGTFASIALLATDRGATADVWVADHLTHKTLVRRLYVGDPGAPNAASDLAVRSVELLRASLLEVSAPQKRELPPALARWLGAPPPDPPAPPSPLPERAPSPPAAATPARTPSAPWPTVAGVEAAAGVLAGGSFGAAPAAVLRVAASLPWHLAVRATVAPTASAQVGAAAGTVALRQDLLMGELTLAFGGEDAVVFPLVAAGGGYYHLRVDGTAKTPYVGEHHDAGAALVSAGAGLGVRVRRGITLLADGSALVLQPEPVVTVLGQTVAATGRPAFFGSFGLVLDLP